MRRLDPRSHHAPATWAAIALAGGAGSLLRYAITSGGGWVAVVAANALGCAVLGALVARRRATPALAVGFCGGLTTFSGMAAQALTAGQGHPVGALDAGGDAGARLITGAAFLLVLNAVVGLVAFLAARRAAGPGGAAAPPTGAPTEAMPR